MCAPLRAGTSLIGVYHSWLAPVLHVCTTQGWHKSYRCALLRTGISLTGVHYSGLASVLQVCSVLCTTPRACILRQLGTEVVTSVGISNTSLLSFLREQLYHLLMTTAPTRTSFDGHLRQRLKHPWWSRVIATPPGGHLQ